MKLYSDCKNDLPTLPSLPGCYQFLNEEGKVIYVGKAKNLKKRVSSYFNKVHDCKKTQIMVRQIREVKYIVVPNEAESYILENNLIKELQPRYNVLLKDDKSYPFIVIKKEFFPRVFPTRKIVKDGSHYFGPYTSVKSIRALMEIIHKVYNVRTCRLDLTPEKIANRKFKVCLQYHMKRCQGVCQGLQTMETYDKQIKEISEILNGNINIIGNQLKDEMNQLASQLRFEEAHLLKEKLILLENFKEKSLIISNLNYNIDVFGYSDDENCAYINYLRIVNGAVIQGYTFEYKKKLDETPQTLLGMGIIEMQQRYGNKSHEIIVPFIPDLELPNVLFSIPQRGDKRKLLELSLHNVKQYKLDKLKKIEQLNPEQRTIRILTTLQKDLHLSTLPLHIECFDNSNIQGSNAVAACVVFKKAKPAKKEYRHFAIKTVVGVDDYASMREIIERRYSRALKESNSLPQLIVIDGGKGQLNATVESLQKIGLYGKIAVIGIAKRLEEIYFPDDPTPLYLDKNSESLKLIQQLRNEAHRFGLTYHQLKRSKTQLVSELDLIKGIGPETKKKLLAHFKSIKRLKEASEEEIKNMVGESRGEIVWKWVKKTKP